MNSPCKLLLVEDNPGDAELAAECLHGVPGFPYELTHVRRLRDALDALGRESFDVVLLDLNLPDSTGIQTLLRLRAADQAAAVLVLTGNPDDDLRRRARCEGAQDLLGKDEPVTRFLGRSVLYALERYRSEKQHRQIRRLISSIPDAVIVTDPQGIVRYVNPAGLALFGRHEEDLVGESLNFSVGEGQPTEIEVLDGLRRCIGEMSVARVEWEGEPAFLATIRDVTDRRKAEAVAREHKATLEARVHARTADLEAANLRLQAEVAERKRVEEVLRERTAQLEGANKELEAFSYSVSHDLRSPLRAIDGFSRILLEEYAESLPEEAQVHLRSVRGNAQQMGRLVDDLLAFARVGRHAIEKHPLDPAPLVQRCLEELRPEWEGRRLELIVGELLPCVAEPSLLKQVWINLLSNAIKYTRGRGLATIEIGCLELGQPLEEPVYFVKDNGVGFDMRYATKLFGVFQRMHHIRVYEGTGVGLAIVQRIVHRHGGRVWAEAESGRGATFFFTLSGGHSDAS